MVVKALNYGSEICRFFMANARRNPKCASCSVSMNLANNVRKTIGKKGGTFFVTIVEPNGLTKTVVKTPWNNSILKEIRYPDGSWSNTLYERMKPIRTEGEYILKDKNGKLLKNGYGCDGYLTPEKAKKGFMATLDDLGKPNREADIRDVFGERPKSKILRFLGDVKYKVGNFFKSFNKTNTAWRRYAKSIDINA